MNTLIALGDAIKATPTGLVSGYLVRFGDETNTDLTGDFFTKDTDFGRPFVKGVPQPLNLYYAHGFDPVIGKKAVGTGTIKMDEVGLWFEAQINQSDAYRKKLAEMATMKSQVDSAPVLGYSSGAASHLVERVPIKDATGNVKASRIASWPLGEGSLTPRPCESQNTVEGKSLLLTEEEMRASLNQSRKSLKGYLYTDDDEAAASMAMAILTRAHDRLYSTFYDVVRYNNAPREQRLAALEEALDEFEDICLRYAGAVLMGTAQETPEEAGEGIEAMKTALKGLPTTKTTPEAAPPVASLLDMRRAESHALDGWAMRQIVELATPVAPSTAP
jgi:phage head maturation protease